MLDTLKRQNVLLCGSERAAALKKEFTTSGAMASGLVGLACAALHHGRTYALVTFDKDHRQQLSRLSEFYRECAARKKRFRAVSNG